MRVLYNLAAALVMLGSAATASAEVVDPTGDFLGTYTGPQNGDVDLLGANVTFDGDSFNLWSQQNGSIGTTAGSLFVWGINRGTGTARLAGGTPSLGGDVPFDSVVVMFPDGLLRVVTIPLAGAPTITNLAGGVTIDGDTLAATVPLSLLFSMGFAPEDYTFTLWSRTRVNPLADGANSEIADFAPNAAGRP